MKKDRKISVLEAVRSRYLRGNRKEKSRLLSELCDLHGFNRKYLIQVFNGLTGKKYVKRGRKSVYQRSELLEPLTRIWLASDQLCSKKLRIALREWLPFYDQPITESAKKKLQHISAATIDRLLNAVRAHYKRRGLSGTKPGYLLKNQIEIRTDYSDVTAPGFMEADTVAHCGNSLAGDFVWSLTMTDIVTAWTENRATWNKGESGVHDQIKDIEENLPFKLLGFDCDNGGEFITWHLHSYFKNNRTTPVQFTRSRPYRKNDNAHVEQKNWTHVRHLFGYDRFDHPELVMLMNDLYKHEWNFYQNYFIPTMKLVKKEKINSKYRKTYEKEPKTPYQRVMESPAIEEEMKKRLQKIHSELNPFELKKTIEKKLKIIFSYVKTCSIPRSKI